MNSKLWKRTQTSELTYSSLEKPLTPDAQFFFMHIPKTAGTTLIQVLEQHFDPQEIASWLYPFQLVDKAPEFFRNHRYFHGHVEYAVMCSYLSQPPITMTILRHPVERYLSQFGNHKRVSLLQIPDWTAEIYNEFQRVTLEEFVCGGSEIISAESRAWLNKQAKMLAGKLTANDDGTIDPSERCLCTPTLEEAKQRLDEFAFFGLSERFQESVFLMAYTFGWMPRFEYETANASPPGLRPYQSEISNDLVREIEKLNLIDLGLYTYAEEQFEIRYEQMCEELLEQYGGWAQRRRSLSRSMLIELLDKHYRRRFRERTVPSAAVFLDYNSRIDGRNWWWPEKDAFDTTYRWTGPGPCATLDLALQAGADLCLRFCLMNAITPSTLATLIVRANGEVIPLDYSRSSPGLIFSGHIQKRVVARTHGYLRLTFEVERTQRPVDVIKGNDDRRPLGIAMAWIELRPIRRPLETRKILTRANHRKLCFAGPQEPQVSIITVTYGCRDIVNKALTKLKENTESVFELIIIDSASPDDTPDWLESNVHGARIIRSTTNLGYGGGSNLAAKDARSPLLLFLNPDAFVTEGWLPPLLKAVSSDGVGIVGPQLRYPNGILQGAGSLVFRTALTARYGDGDQNPDAPAYRYPRVADYVSGACLLVRRELFRDLGGFDPIFGLGYYEETDLCFKAAALGLSVMYVPESVVQHVSGASGGQQTLAATIARNRQLFAQRWAETLQKRPDSPSDPAAVINVRDARARSRILFVGPAVAHAIEVSKHDYRLAITAVGSDDGALSSYVETVPNTNDWFGWFENRHDHYDVVVGNDVRFDSLIDATQPRARRISGWDSGDLGQL